MVISVGAVMLLYESTEPLTLSRLFRDLAYVTLLVPIAFAFALLFAVLGLPMAVSIFGMPAIVSSVVGVLAGVIGCVRRHTVYGRWFISIALVLIGYTSLIGLAQA